MSARAPSRWSREPPRSSTEPDPGSRSPSSAARSRCGPTRCFASTSSIRKRHSHHRARRAERHHRHLDDNSARGRRHESFRYAADSYQSGPPIPSTRAPGGTPSDSGGAADNLAAGLTAAEHRTRRRSNSRCTSRRLEVRHLPVPEPDPVGRRRERGPVRRRARGDPVNVLLRIYTVAGRLIRALRSEGGLGQVQIPGTVSTKRAAPWLMESIFSEPR